MTPKEKALKLYIKYRKLEGKWGDKVLYNNYDVKECIFIAVDELINCTLPCCEFGGEIDYCTSEYWTQVKHEIKKL
jgi:hypothetical protein